MAIDNPIDAFEAQYKESGDFPLELILLPTELALPHVAPLLKFVKLITERFSANARRERAQAFLNLLRDQQRILEVLGNNHDKLKVTVSDLAEAIQVAVIRDAEAFNDNKRTRYLNIIGNAVRSDTQIDDLAAFIRDVEALAEEDIIVLKLLNKLMNQPGDTHHQLNFILPQRRKRLAEEIAKALGLGKDQPYNHESGYSVCARLRGFGLAHEVFFHTSEEIPITEYCFRPSKRGLILLHLMAEEVPNWQIYFPAKQ